MLRLSKLFQRKYFGFVLALISVLFIGFFVLLFVLSFAGIFPLQMPISVNGRSMQPTIYASNLINCYPYSAFLHDLFNRPRHKFKRGEIVIALSPHGDKDHIKRIIALPFDKVKIGNGRVYVNGIEQIENYTLEKYNTNVLPEEQMKANIEYQVPKNKYFLLGDNRELSGDSREYGFYNEPLCLLSKPEYMFGFNK